MVNNKRRKKSGRGGGGGGGLEARRQSGMGVVRQKKKTNFRGSETDFPRWKFFARGGEEQAETKNVRSPERKKNTDTI